MVVYLYKKGRQTMKNIIKTIAIVLVSLISQVSNAQVFIKVVVEDFYNFEFSRSMSASEALKSGNFKQLQGTTGKTEYIFNEYSKKVTVVLPDGTKTDYNMLGYANGNKRAYLVMGPGFDGENVRIMMSLTESENGVPYLIVEHQSKDNPKLQRAFASEILN
jgi:hypothetical protein